MAMEDNQEAKKETEDERRLRLRFSRAARKSDGVMVQIKGVGSIRLKGGNFTCVKIGACWAYLTHNGSRFRTDTTQDKEKLVAGNLSVTLLPLDAPQPPPPLNEEVRSRGFLPRSRRFGTSPLVPMTA